MKTPFEVLVLSAVLLSAPATARPTDDGSAAVMAVEATPEAASPPSAPPALSPPAPTETLPAPPAQEQAQPVQAVPPGQWVYTSQYGWVWMPYGDAYTYAPPNGYGQPYEYVYYPAYGWTWVVAPWVWGWGPWPFFGVIGPARFAWFGHGWWRFPGRWHFVAPAFGRGFGFHGVRPAPFHWGGSGRWGGSGFRGAPAFHSAAPAFRSPAFRGAPMHQGSSGGRGGFAGGGHGGGRH